MCARPHEILQNFRIVEPCLEFCTPFRMLLSSSNAGETMKRVIFPIFLLIAFATAPLIAQPKIQVVGGTTLDLGDAFTGQKVEHVINVKNVGNDTLLISDVHAQCGCTATMMSDADKKLAPNTVGKVSFTFDTHNYGGNRPTKQV